MCNVFSKIKKAAVPVAIATAASLGLSAPAMADWSPKKPVELIIMAGAGGGADQIARLLQGLIEKKDLSPRPIIPINKPGGSGAEALRYIQDKAGDDHTILVTLNSFYTTPVIQKGIGVDVSNFTPIGRMAIDNEYNGVALDESAVQSPAVRAGWFVGSFSHWLDMADVEGYMVWHFESTKVFSLEELGEDYIAHARARNALFDVSPEFDEGPDYLETVERRRRTED